MVEGSHIKPGDMILVFLMDSMQLYCYKLSNCWIGIWIVFNHRPNNHYKKLCILPAFFIHSPNKPKNCNSYLYPSLHHLAALQKEGLHVWDTLPNGTFLLAQIFALATADGPGMVYLNGLVGHHSKNACQLYCDVARHQKPGGSHHYPTLLKLVICQGCD